jgi:hypothetical protein
MAVRACVIEGKGDCNPSKLAEYQHIMRSLWDEISDLADFDKVIYLKVNLVDEYSLTVYFI